MKRSRLRGNIETHRAWQERTRQTAIEKARTARPKDTGPSNAQRDRLSERSGRHCELCGRYLLPGIRQVHHRQPRGIGGSPLPEINDLSVLLDLDYQCHLRIERNRTWAKERGLLVPRPAVPALVRVDLRHGLVLLDDEGHYLPCEGAAA